MKKILQQLNDEINRKVAEASRDFECNTVVRVCVSKGPPGPRVLGSVRVFTQQSLVNEDIFKCFNRVGEGRKSCCNAFSPVR